MFNSHPAVGAVLASLACIAAIAAASNAHAAETILQPVSQAAATRASSSNIPIYKQRSNASGKIGCYL